MNKVHILPPEIISKISAGEVIERPASVIKELVENSLDANTESVELSLTKAGKTSIYVKDTGTGIEPEDIEKIFYRHSTSKIHTIEDLFAIHSLGFRGEALYSIAAISDITLRSKTKNNDTGWEVHIRGNEKIKLHPVSMAEGTEIEVKELFFNTPARKKFLKSDTAELQQILNLFIPYTLLYPTKRFCLKHHHRTIIDLSPEENHINRIGKVLNLKPEYIIETKKTLQAKFSPAEFYPASHRGASYRGARHRGEDATNRSIRRNSYNISIHFILGDINIQRPRKDMQFIFVNNRPVQNRFISFHLNEVYRLIFTPDTHPFFAVYLNVPPENIDVNVHPTKREVKIKNESELIPLLRTLCEQTLMSDGKAKEMEKTLFGANSFHAVGDTFHAWKNEKLGKCPLPRLESAPPVVVREEQRTFSQEKTPATPQEADLKNKLSSAHYIGPFLKKYLFFESGQSLLVIDQHAAQERITYEQLVQDIKSCHIEVQRLLVPIVIGLSPQEKLSWEMLKALLEKIGLETTRWDSESIAIHTHPQLIKKPEVALRNVLSGEGTMPFDIPSLVRAACRNSLMAGDKISPQEALYLRKKLVACNNPFTCPHSRPTVVEIKDKTLEKEFLRK